MNTRINVPDNPKCNNLNKIWTQLGLNEFLCAPRISPNDSSKIFKAEAGKNLTLECSFYVDNGHEAQVMPIKWFWHDRTLSNNSEGVVAPQKFTIYELDSTVLDNKEKRKVRTSRLEIIYILELNKGTYGCQARNEAGFAGHNFTVEVSSPTGVPPRKVGTAFPEASAAASIESGNKNAVDNNSSSKAVPTASSLVIGLVLGILFGIFLVLILFGIVVVLLCRRRNYRRRSSLGNNRVVAIDSELEKLTTSTLSGSTPSVLPSCPSTAPSVATTIINPVQKPPRVAFSGTSTPTGTPQVWLIKRGNDSGNGILRSDGDGCCETPLPLCEYDIESYATLTAAIEPDLIHNPTSFMRNNFSVSEEQISLHSDGTEV
ncbi:leucine-rich repeat-containing protein 24-like protein [Leptotrombidium deliense]|uniref:Leucine-rich repeat-containing protein 24-like protein n=1 Tax=Leptotrombidium deliense TaxID=299467 RepID=A0A443SLM3_9ACAR|nr:leucine-rich repeat-containing protein 24-like protein [Leptotrombidium deliense]